MKRQDSTKENTEIVKLGKVINALVELVSGRIPSKTHVRGDAAAALRNLANGSLRNQVISLGPLQNSSSRNSACLVSILE